MFHILIPYATFLVWPNTKYECYLCYQKWIKTTSFCFSNLTSNSTFSNWHSSSHFNSQQLFPIQLNLTCKRSILSSSDSNYMLIWRNISSWINYQVDFMLRLFLSWSTPQYLELYSNDFRERVSIISLNVLIIFFFPVLHPIGNELPN